MAQINITELSGLGVRAEIIQKSGEISNGIFMLIKKYFELKHSKIQECKWINEDFLKTFFQNIQFIHYSNTFFYLI